MKRTWRFWCARRCGRRPRREFGASLKALARLALPPALERLWLVTGSSRVRFSVASKGTLPGHRGGGAVGGFRLDWATEIDGLSVFPGRVLGCLG